MPIRKLLTPGCVLVALWACDAPLQPTDDTRPTRAELAVTNPTAAVSVTVALRDLGTLGGSSVAGGINAAGDVVGGSVTSGGEGHAFLWTEGRGMVDLGTLGGDSAAAHGVNAARVVVGQSKTASGQRRAFRWTEQTGMVALGHLNPGDIESMARDVNDDGFVVGYIEPGAGQSRTAVIWTPDGRVMSAGAVGGAWRINDLGEFAIAVSGAPIWHIGTVTGGLRTLASPTDISLVFLLDINRRGQVAGWAFGEGRAAAVHWDPDVGWTRPSTPADLWSAAYGMNDADEIVGEIGPPGAFRPVMWTSDRAVVELPMLDGASRQAAGQINSRRQIAGTAVFADGRPSRAVRWQVSLGPVAVDIEVRGDDDDHAVELDDDDDLQVVVYTTDAFDARDIDPATLTLGNDDGDDTPVTAEVDDDDAAEDDEDAGDEDARPHLRDVDRDGDLDLVVAFSIEAMVRNGDLTHLTTELVLNGVTTDGTRIRGVDSVAVARDD